jgi:hypothetical protein
MLLNIVKNQRNFVYNLIKTVKTANMKTGAINAVSNMKTTNKKSATYKPSSANKASLVKQTMTTKNQPSINIIEHSKTQNNVWNNNTKGEKPRWVKPTTEITENQQNTTNTKYTNPTNQGINKETLNNNNQTTNKDKAKTTTKRPQPSIVPNGK